MVQKHGALVLYRVYRHQPSPTSTGQAVANGRLQTRLLTKMACEHPRIVPNARARAYGSSAFENAKMLTPCGLCWSCTLNKFMRLGTNLEIETLIHPRDTCWFGTLTYNDEHLPLTEFKPEGEFTVWQSRFLEVQQNALTRGESGTRAQGFTDEQMADVLKARDPQPTLRRKDVVDWRKRCAKALGRTPRIFFTGEYGDRYGRPHYHFCAYGLQNWEMQLCLQKWNLCDVERREALPMLKGAGNYCGKEVAKGALRNKHEIIIGIEPTAQIGPKKIPIGGALRPHWLNTMISALNKLGPEQFEAEVAGVNGIPLGRVLRAGGKKFSVSDWVYRTGFEKIEWLRDPAIKNKYRKARALEQANHERKLDSHSEHYCAEYAALENERLKSVRERGQTTKRRHDEMVRAKKLRTNKYV